jgi:hypothetical protein
MFTISNVIILLFLGKLHHGVSEPKTNWNYRPETTLAENKAAADKSFIAHK